MYTCSNSVHNNDLPRYESILCIVMYSWLSVAVTTVAMIVINIIITMISQCSNKYIPKHNANQITTVL